MLLSQLAFTQSSIRGPLSCCSLEAKFILFSSFCYLLWEWWFNVKKNKKNYLFSQSTHKGSRKILSYNILQRGLHQSICKSKDFSRVPVETTPAAFRLCRMSLQARSSLSSPISQNNTLGAPCFCRPGGTCVLFLELIPSAHTGNVKKKEKLSFNILFFNRAKVRANRKIHHTKN